MAFSCATGMTTKDLAAVVPGARPRLQRPATIAALGEPRHGDAALPGQPMHSPRDRTGARVGFAKEEEVPARRLAAGAMGRRSMTGAVSFRGTTRGTTMPVTEYRTAMTLGQLTVLPSEKEEQEPRFKHFMALAAPAAAHALTLAAAGGSCFLTSGGHTSSALAIVPLAAYVVGSLFLLIMGCLQACFPYKQVQMSPVIASVFHFTLFALEGYFNGLTWRAWEAAAARLAMLQAVAMRVHPASRSAWLAVWLMASPAIAALVASLGELTPLQVLQTLVLPLVATLVLALLAGPDSPSSDDRCLRRLALVVRHACLGGPSVQQIAERHGMPLHDAANGTLQELLSVALAVVKAAPLLPTWSSALERILQSAIKQLKAQQPADMEEMAEDCADVQQFVMGLVEPHASMQIQSFSLGLAGGRRVLPFEEHMKGLTRPLLRIDVPSQEDATVDPGVRGEISADLGRWGLDVETLSQRCGGRTLALMAHAALRPHVSSFGMEQERLQPFLSSLESRYHASNSYHNSVHAADVLNSMVFFLRRKSGPMGTIQPLEFMAAVVAAAAHDVGHDGRSNTFHVAAESLQARLFNDQSCLEHMHCAITFGLLASKGTNFLNVLSFGDFASFRRTVVPMILDTDLARHFQSLSAFQQEFPEKAAPGEDTPKRRQMLLGLVLKACDVGASAKPFAIHAKWAAKINAEFYLQGDKERELGLPTSPLCDRSAGNISASQKGFYSFFVKPLFTALAGHLRSLRVQKEVMSQVAANYDFWLSYDPHNFNYEDPERSVPELVRCFTLTRLSQPLGVAGCREKP